MLKVVSDNKALRHLAQGLAKNDKYKFDVKVGKWSITVKGSADVAEHIFHLFNPSFSPLCLKRSGDKVFIYDNDVLLNRKFLTIFLGTISPDVTHAGLGVRLVVGNELLPVH